MAAETFPTADRRYAEDRPEAEILRVIVDKRAILRGMGRDRTTLGRQARIGRTARLGRSCGRDFARSGALPKGITLSVACQRNPSTSCSSNQAGPRPAGALALSMDCCASAGGVTAVEPLSLSPSLGSGAQLRPDDVDDVRDGTPDRRDDAAGLDFSLRRALAGKVAATGRVIERLTTGRVRVATRAQLMAEDQARRAMSNRPAVRLSHEHSRLRRPELPRQLGAVSIIGAAEVRRRDRDLAAE
jgi:hypothetical protein